MTDTALTIPTTPAAYKYWVDEHVRFADLDLIGHVNNKAYATYGESCRAAFLREVGLWEPGAPRQSVIVKLEINYLRELHYPNRIRIGLCVLRMGDKSCTFGLGVFKGEECISTMLTVMVRIDAVSRKAVTLNDQERAALAGYRV
ncbi:MAG TPA: thioesterase family protein [Fontimonas sp.]